VALVPVTTATLIPRINHRTGALMNANLTQFVSPQFGLFAGKISMPGPAVTEFCGDYRTQFEKRDVQIPYHPGTKFRSRCTAAALSLILLSTVAVNPDGRPTRYHLEAFSDGVEVLASGKLTIKPVGLVGHESIGFSWNNKQRFSLIQDPVWCRAALMTVSGLASHDPIQ
jgi:porin